MFTVPTALLMSSVTHCDCAFWWFVLVEACCDGVLQTHYLTHRIILQYNTLIPTNMTPALSTTPPVHHPPNSHGHTFISNIILYGANKDRCELLYLVQ